MGIQLFLENARLSYPKLDLPDYYKGVKQRPNDVKRWDASFIVDPNATARLGNTKGPQSNAFKLINESIDKLAVELMADKAKAWKLRVLTDPKACAWTDGARKEMDGFFVMATHLSLIHISEPTRPY